MTQSLSTSRATPATSERRKPQRLNFTERNVQALRPRRDAQYQVWDSGTGAARGLSILVSSTGTKSYRATYYFPGNANGASMHLGRVGELTLDEARTRATGARRMAADGIDPKAADPRTSNALKDAICTYIQQRQIGKKGNKSALETQGVLLNHCAAWALRPVGTIRAHEIEALLALVRDGDGNGRKGAPYMSLRLHAHLHDFFKWLSRPGGALTASPMVGIEAPWDGAKPRDLPWFKGDAADDAVKAIWQAADTLAGSDPDAARFLKAMLLTGKRRAALAAMRWEQITDDWFWDAPASTSKNKRLHGIPLSRLAQRVLGQRQATGAVFGSVARASFNFEKLTQKVRQLTGLGDFILHGVRHLCETKMGELGVPPHLRDVIYDHVPNRGSGAGYDHGTYRAEMTAALELWAAHVQGVSASPGVARLR